jgi:hypothetical protein
MYIIKKNIHTIIRGYRFNIKKIFGKDDKNRNC